MKIAIDARAYSWAGIGRYIRNLIDELAKRDDEHTYVVLLTSDDVALFRKQFGSSIAAGKVREHIVEGAYYSWREQLVLPLQLAAVRADLWHFPHFNVPRLFNAPYVVTVHDITRFIFPGQQRQSWWQQVAYEYVFAQAVKRARTVITVSEATRHELESLSFVLQQDPLTIYEGVGEQFEQPVTSADRQAVRDQLQITEPYLLYVGVWMSHKNLRRLFEAFAEVVRLRSNVKLVVTGQAQVGYVPLPQLAQEFGIEQQVLFPGFVSAKLLPALYAEAEALVFPSLYEGFGLPALEAAAVGTPVIASNVTSLPEIMGDAAYYVNPEHTPSITAGIEAVLTNKDLRRQLTSAGQRRVREFRWQDTAERHVAVYEQAVRA